MQEKKVNDESKEKNICAQWNAPKRSKVFLAAKCDLNEKIKTEKEYSP